MLKKVIKYTLSFGLAALLVYFAFREIDWKDFMDNLQQTRWSYIILFFVVSILALWFREERWKLMLQPIDPEVKSIVAWDASNVGNLLNTVLPGAGEFARCGYMLNGRLKYEKTFGTIVCERVWDVFAVLLLFVFSLVWKWEELGTFFVEKIWKPSTDGGSLNLWWMLVVFVLLVTAFIFATIRYKEKYTFFGKIASVASELWAGFIIFTKMRRKWLFVLYTIGIWLMYMLMSYYTFLALPGLEHLDFMDALFLSSVGNIASVIPVPGGFGAYHYLIAISLQSIYGASWEMGLLYATLNHELHAALIIVLGVISYFTVMIRRRKTTNKVL